MNDSVNGKRFSKFDEMSVAGYIDGLNAQIDELISPYIFKNELMFSDDENGIYQAYVKLRADIAVFYRNYLSNQMTSEEIESKLNGFVVMVENLIGIISEIKKK